MAGDTLLSYIAKTPFMQYEKVWTKVTPITQRLARRKYEQGVNFYIIDKMTQPQADAAQRFSGKVWVLVNHHSFSAAASFAWTVKAFKIGTLVGEEAGGMNFPMAMWWVMYCPIPNYNSAFLSNVFGFSVLMKTIYTVHCLI